jgi:hypothetical protein
VTFTATAVADTPTQLVIVAGNANGATIIGQSVATAPRVAVRDQHGNGIAGRSVTFAASAPGSAPSPVVTGANGEASTTWTVGATGTVLANGTFTNTLTASTTGLTPLLFTVAARYSYATHVYSIVGSTSLSHSCVTCHDASGPPPGGMNLQADAPTLYNTITGSFLGCDSGGTMVPAGYRRVSSAGGINAADSLSILMRYADPNVGDQVGTCGPHGGGNVFSAGDARIGILRAWIRNGAPNN